MPQDGAAGRKVAATVTGLPLPATAGKAARCARPPDLLQEMDIMASFPRSTTISRVLGALALTAGAALAVGCSALGPQGSRAHCAVFPAVAGRGRSVTAAATFRPAAPS